MRFGDTGRYVLGDGGWRRDGVYRHRRGRDYLWLFSTCCGELFKSDGESRARRLPKR
jgi:hypothetical protein